MDEFKWSDEQLEAIQQAVNAVNQAIEEFARRLVTAFLQIWEAIKKWIIEFFRSAAIIQLMEWHIPDWLARLIVRYSPTYFMLRLGYCWINRHFSGQDDPVT